MALNLLFWVVATLYLLGLGFSFMVGGMRGTVVVQYNRAVIFMVRRAIGGALVWLGNFIAGTRRRRRR